MAIIKGQGVLPNFDRSKNVKPMNVNGLIRFIRMAVSLK